MTTRTWIEVILGLALMGIAVSYFFPTKSREARKYVRETVAEWLGESGRCIVVTSAWHIGEIATNAGRQTGPLHIGWTSAWNVISGEFDNCSLACDGSIYPKWRKGAPVLVVYDTKTEAYSCGIFDREITFTGPEGQTTVPARYLGATAAGVLAS